MSARAPLRPAASRHLRRVPGAVLAMLAAASLAARAGAQDQEETADDPETVVITPTLSPSQAFDVKRRAEAIEQMRREQGGGQPARAPAQPQPAGAATARAVGRNEPCPCGSGKKYKKCHGA